MSANETREEPPEELRPQKENAYNKLLPYGHLLEGESERLFDEIKTNLIKSVLVREIRPGCMVWTTRFLKYTRIYGLKFSKKDHIDLIHLFYELLTIPNLEPTRINIFVAALQVLLKKDWLLSPKELQLEWRPLYDLCVRVLEKSKTKIGMYKHFASLEGVIKSVIFLCRIYFPVEATQEILDEFKPYLGPFSSSSAYAIQHLDLFLPVVVFPGQESIGYKLWFEELMKFWEVCHNASDYEMHLMNLMAKLVERNPGMIDWEPYIPIMYVRFLRAFHLPVGYRQKQSNRKYKMEIFDIAVWIVFTLGDRNDKGFFHLEKFMQSLESYYHSANMGKWKPKLFKLINRLAFFFVERVHIERYKKPSWKLKTPEEFKLTDAQIERFVNILKPCIEHAMFSHMGNREVADAMQYLAALRPDIIVPLVLDKVYASMNSLTEPHKLTASMTCLTSVSRFMVSGAKYNYPEGPTHVIPLLNTCLPGIDPNDFRKCCMTFSVISVLVTLAPLVDCSQASTHFNDLTEEEHIICEASAGLEDFVLQFFDRICTWVEAHSLEFTRMEQTDNDFKSRMELVSERALFTAITVVLHQCSSDIFTSALKKIKNFALNRILESKVSGKMVAILCASFAKVNPKETMKAFLPELCDILETLLGSGDEVVKEEQLNDELIYNMLLLSEVVDARSELLPYVDQITKILDRTLHMTSDKGCQLAARTLSLIMSTLTITEPLDYRSSNLPFTGPAKGYFPIRDWAKPGDLDNLNVSWHVPGKKEVDCVEALINKYLIPELDRLNKYSKGEIVLDKKELRRSLRIVSSVLSAESVLPSWDEEPLQLVDSVIDTSSLELIVGGPHIAKLPDGRNVRKVVADSLHNVQKKILEIDEGDTRSINLIVVMFDTILFNKIRGQDFERQFTLFVMNKRSVEDRLHQNKSHLRQILLERLMLHHIFRKQSRTCCFTDTHKQILLDLFELSVSHYSEVRTTAQNKLFAALSTFPYCYRILVPQIKEILQLDTTVHHEKFKGCLHVLLGPKLVPLFTRHDWALIKEVWPLLINSKPSEKLSIVRLINALQDNVFRFFPTITIKFSMPEKCLDAAYKLAKNKPMVDVEKFREIIDKGAEIEKRLSEQREADHAETVCALLKACNSGNLHWRYYTMALNLIKEIVHRDTKYSPDVVRLFLGALIDDSLEIRKIALRVCLFILVQNKPTFKKVVFSETTHSEVVYPGIRPDNEWLLYDSKTVPKTETEWETTRYLHEEGFGYYSWPTKVEVYAPSSQQNSFAKRISNLSGVEHEIFQFFSNDSNVIMFVKYLSMEEKKGKDQFNGIRFLFFKNFFKTYEDHFLPIFIAELEKLVSDKQEQSQRCAMEIMAGLMSGAKHWNFQQSENLWSQLLPILNTGISNISVETLIDWSTCISRCLQDRDPNRYHKLLEFLLKDPLADGSSFVSCGRLHILKAALKQQSWRNAELISRLYDYLSKNLCHPFQNVRDNISSCLAMIFSANLKFPNQNSARLPEVADFFQHVMPRLDLLYENILQEAEKTTRHSPGTSDNFKVVALNDEKEKLNVMCLFKTVAKYLTYSLTLSNYSTVPDHYQLLPLVCVLQNNDTDEEFSLICTNLLAMFAHSLILPETIPIALEVIGKISTCPFWSARAVLAEFIPVFVFHNFATLASKTTWVAEIQRIVLLLLEDEQPEVRIRAGEILSGLLHCQFVLDQTELIDLFKQKSRTKLTSKTANHCTGNVSNGNSKAIRVRHAGVLGFCAFVSSHPYDVPDFLPDVFLELGKHLNDPQPIPATIRQTFGNFKRTHHANWEVHKLKFTEDELSLLSDLTVPPSYYA